YAIEAGTVYLVREGTGWELRPRSTETTSHGETFGIPELLAPMPGAVVSIEAADGQEVSEGAAIVVVEAMKMEHILRAPHAGTVAIHTGAGQQVAANQILATIAPRPARPSSGSDEGAQ